MTLLLGGVKSGKSGFAIRLAMAKPAPRAFIATAEPIDDEMKARIQRHRRERADRFQTFEEPTDIWTCLGQTEGFNVVVIDCITVWLGNLIHHRKNVDRSVRELISALRGNEIIVSNEVGLGVIAPDPETREYVEMLGRINAELAELADEVYLMVAGIPIKVK